FSRLYFLSFPTRRSSDLFIVLIAALQWIVGAKISYSFGKAHHKYYMYVEEDVYMSYVVPGVFAMAIGLFIIRNHLSIEHIKNSLDRKSTRLNSSHVKISY